RGCCRPACARLAWTSTTTPPTRSRSGTWASSLRPSWPPSRLSGRPLRRCPARRAALHRSLDGGGLAPGGSLLLEPDRLVHPQQVESHDLPHPVRRVAPLQQQPRERRVLAHRGDPLDLPYLRIESELAVEASADRVQVGPQAA